MALEHRKSPVVQTPVLDANTVVRLNQTHAVSHKVRVPAGIPLLLLLGLLPPETYHNRGVTG